MPDQRKRPPTSGGVTVPPPSPVGMSPVLERNIAALSARRTREDADAPWPDRLAAAITRFAGSMTFAALHAVVFGVWALVNSGLLPILPKWDETFVILGTTASVEAIFLSTFVLISQNRMAAIEAKRSDLDLQISLLAEHEITRLLSIAAGIADHLGVRTSVDGEVSELEQDVAPEKVLDEIEVKGAESGSA